MEAASALEEAVEAVLVLEEAVEAVLVSEEAVVEATALEAEEDWDSGPAGAWAGAALSAPRALSATAAAAA